MTTTRESTTSQVKTQVGGNFFFYLQVVFGVAIVLATLFTTFPPPAGVLPESSPVNDENITGKEVLSETSLPTPLHPVLRIGILAGHSGGVYYDPGAVCSDALGGTKEVDINSAVAARVKDLLNREGYEVDILSEWDPLLEGYLALTFVSIHTDSCEYVNPEATGFKLASTSLNALSSRLESCLQDRYIQSTEMKLHPGVTTDMTDYHAFYSISNQTPAAIIELGFMNLDHDRLLTNQAEMAQGISNGILCFLRNEPIATPLPTPSTEP